jgi:hypothetical protein
MPSFAIANNEFLQIVEDGKEGDSETTLESIGFPLRSIPPFLLHHDARRMDMACDDLHNKDTRTMIGLPESRPKRKRARSTLQLDLQTVLPKDIPNDIRPLHTTTSNNNVPIATGSDTEVMIHCLSESEPDDNSYLIVIHRSEHAIKRLIVSNCAGYWISDFSGIGAYQQLLLVPKFDERRDTAGSYTSSDTTKIENAVRGSLLTDGKELWAPRDVHLEIPSKLTLPAQRDLPDDYSKYPRIHLSGHATFDSNSLTTIPPSTDAKICPSVAGHLPSPWIGIVVERALEKRAGEKKKKMADSQNRIRQSRHVLGQGKTVLEELSCTPQVTPLRLLRLKYLSQPNMSLTGDAKKQDVSAAILLEMDLQHTCHPGDSEPPGTELGLRGVHLSLTIAPAKTSSVNGIRTRSGLVPLLKRDQVTTIMVMAELDDISFTGNNSVQEMDAGVNIDVQALWVDGPDSKRCRRGAHLASFTVSFGALLLPSRKLKIIDFALPHAEVEGSYPLGPIYECRKPCLVEIDLSSYRLDRNAWLQEVQESLCGSCFRVENVKGNDGSVLLNLALYAFPTSAISGLIQILKSSLPNNVVLLQKGDNTS